MKILIADDELNIRESIQKLLNLNGINSVSVPDGQKALEALKAGSYDAVVTDLRMPNVDGQALLERMRSAGFQCPVIMMSAFGDIGDAVKAIKAGACDYLIKPFNPDELIRKIRNASRNFARADDAGSSGRAPGIGLVGESEAIKKIRRTIGRLSDSDATVLITGESGVGKEVVARQIYAASSRASLPFVAVNIGAVNENLMESELFGHERGSFTGADERRIGLFELAGSGTLFLDELCEMPLKLQVKLLRVLQERKIRRLGGSADIPIGARFLAATNQNVEELVEAGKFREDLYYRLDVVRIAVPPLRERKEDIPLLSSVLLDKVCSRMSRPKASLSPAAVRELMGYSFPGNVRELENILESAVIYSDGEVIKPEALLFGAGHIDSASRTAGADLYERASSALSMQDLRRIAIEEALAKWGGNRSRAAKELGISRGTLLKRIKSFGLD